MLKSTEVLAAPSVILVLAARPRTLPGISP
jgi:hypothetical protein